VVEYTGVGTEKMSTFERTLVYPSIGLEKQATVDAEEREWIRRCQKGDPNAFNELFNRYRTQVYQLAYRFSRNYADAEDILQNAFIRAFKYIHRFDTQYPFYPWLRAIVTNESQTYLGKRSKRQHEPLETTDPEERNLLDVIPDPNIESADDKIERKQLGKEIHAAILKLPDQQRICFTLFEIEDMKVREIAETLGCTDGTVKTHLHRARFALRTLLKETIKENSLKFRV